MDELEVYQQMMSKDPSSQVFVYLAESLWEREMYEEAIESERCMRRPSKPVLKGFASARMIFEPG
jgi:hypothetical protein